MYAKEYMYIGMEWNQSEKKEITKQDLSKKMKKSSET